MLVFAPDFALLSILSHPIYEREITGSTAFYPSQLSISLDTEEEAHEEAVFGRQTSCATRIREGEVCPSMHEGIGARRDPADITGLQSGTEKTDRVSSGKIYGEEEAVSENHHHPQQQSARTNQDVPVADAPQTKESVGRHPAVAFTRK
jgi:hypothetical protein